jgi:hypothetical protein
MRTYGLHPQAVSVVRAAELTARASQAAAALDGARVCRSVCNDAGSVDATAWKLGEDGTYTQIPLEEDGDVACKNLAPEAEEVAAWLRKLVGVASRHCRYSSGPCPRDPTAPPPNFLEPPPVCDWVPDCSACGGKLCVRGPEGRKHCSMPDSRCGADRTCACQGAALCVGGKSYCHDLPGGILACGP